MTVRPTLQIKPLVSYLKEYFSFRSQISKTMIFAAPWELCQVAQISLTWTRSLPAISNHL